MEIKPIAHFHSPFSTKFGIPKQSGLVEELEGQIIFEPDYRDGEALRGIDQFDYLWLIWEFSANRHEAVGTTVRPPLLGGHVRMGVFATRSPYRPNALGLSSVRLSHVEWQTDNGPIIHVLGADLMEGTPIYDIKPYITYADCHERARSGFVDTHSLKHLTVNIPESMNNVFSPSELEALRKILSLDPRPHYHHDSKRIYGMPFLDHDIHFSVIDDKVVNVLNFTDI